jgi:hypothetical protein
VVGVCSFDTVEAASEAIMAIMRKGIQVGAAELLDDCMVE